jgi:hypothetical protein
MEEPMKRAILLCVLFMFGSGLMALTGFGTSAPVINDTVDPTLSITVPNGGEAWYIGDTNDITWTAEDTNLTPNTINISYSTGGTEYLPLAENIANSGSWPWLMPEVQSYSVRVKISALDDFGNLGEKVSGTFSITYVPPAAPENLSVDISNNVDAVITWDPVTQTIYGTPITPDGYIVLYNESPYEYDEHFYYFLWDVTSGTTFTHPRVAQHRDQMYYRVVAYKDYENRLANIFAAAKANPQNKLSLEDIKTLFLANLGGEK